MQLLRILAVAILLALQSCIPSLYSLVGEENRIINDGILGLWSSYSVAEEHYSSPFDPTRQPGNTIDVQEAIQIFSDATEGDQWLFERVGKLVFNDGKQTVTKEPAVASLTDGQVLEASYDNYYMLTYTRWENRDTTVERLWCELTHIEGQLFVDFSPSYLNNPVYNDQMRFAINYIMGHTFARLSVTDREIVLEPINGEFIADLIEDERIRLKHEVVDDQIILTASTKELRAFIGRYIENEELFSDPEVLASSGG